MVRRFAGAAWWCAFGRRPWASAVRADDGAISARHHSWGRFHPGAWKLVRVVTETFDDHGALASTNHTETKTTLRQVDSDGVRLDIEVGMEVAGKQFDAQPQCIKQGFHGELLSPDLKVKPSQASQLTVDDRKVPCRSQQMELAAGDSKTLITVYYSDTVAPYILKRQSITTGLDGKNLGKPTSRWWPAICPGKFSAKSRTWPSSRRCKSTPRAPSPRWP